MEWQPIETAPKDGKLILLFDDDYGTPYLMGAWNKKMRAWQAPPTASGRSVLWPDATHWTHLPPPPSEA